MLYQFFYYALPKYLQNDLERIQKRALSIIFPGLAYDKALELAGSQTISDYNESICDKTFKVTVYVGAVQNFEIEIFAENKYTLTLFGLRGASDARANFE